MSDDVWTVKRILEWIEGYLRDKGDENPRLSAQWLVSDALGVGRIDLFMDPGRPLSEEERATLRDYTRRRGAGEPLQYITGTTDFRFITVAVERGVLIPRPETEVLVSEALERVDAVRVAKKARIDAADEALVRQISANVAHGEDSDVLQTASAGTPETHSVIGEDSGASVEVSSHVVLSAIERGEDMSPASGGGETLPDSSGTLLVADLCTGSGCIACSIATEIPHAYVIATDIDPKAVALAGKNARDLGVEERVDVLECDLGCGVDEKLMGKFDLVISNPPYIPSNILPSLDAQVMEYESSLALDGGEDGLDIFRRILPFAWQALAPSGCLAVELHEECLDTAAYLAAECGYVDVEIAKDLAGRPRILLARKG